MSHKGGLCHCMVSGILSNGVGVVCVCGCGVGWGGDALERNREGSKDRRKCHIEEWENMVALHVEKLMLGC